ncbi:MAG: hypothetical protein IH899_08750 [Planctomycetes bacterium]|nr:hypothetical protein [Planctomycetota bacterium]
MLQRIRPTILFLLLTVWLLLFEGLNFCAYDVATTAIASERNATSRSAGPAFDVQHGVRQLFLDDVGIEKLDGLKRVVHRPQRHPKNPLIVADTTWERGSQVYGTALYDPKLKKFRMWYLTGPRDRGLKPLKVNGIERPPHTTLVAYAESKDGIRWKKPNLGQFPYDGSTKNNLLSIGKWNAEGISVLYDPRDKNPQRRWKALYWDHGSGGWEPRNGKPFAMAGPHDGIHVAFSPDGIHWTPSKQNPVLKVYSDTNQVVLYDPKINKYVAFGRFGFGRRLARSESADFEHWSRPQLVLQCDAQDGPGTQIYGTGIDLYEGLYLGMIWIYREGGDGKIDTQLAVSRDGIRWTRVGNRATWLKLGPDDSWEGGMVRSVERIIRRGNQLYIYYCGVHGAHTGPKIRKVVRKHRVAIGLLTLRRDGFVSLRAGAETGTLLTKPFRLPAGQLHVNAAVKDKGQITVALCNESGKPMKEFGESKPITGDVLDGTAHWSHDIPGSLRGKTVRLKFTIQNADLYSYWWR